MSYLYSSSQKTKEINLHQVIMAVLTIARSSHTNCVYSEKIKNENNQNTHRKKETKKINKVS